MQLALKTLCYLYTSLVLQSIILNMSQADISKSYICPYYYELAYSETQEEPICYRLKGPERFNDKFYECTGNLYNFKLHKSLNIKNSNKTLWIEYKSSYPGGPVVDWSYTENTGTVLTSATYDNLVSNKDILCFVMNSTHNIIADSCQALHHRYCFFKPYRKSTSKHQGDEGYVKLISPTPVCLSAVTEVNLTVGVNWEQAQDLCKKRSGSLFNSAFIYVEVVTGPPLLFPLGVKYNPENRNIVYDTIDGNHKVFRDNVSNYSSGHNFGAWDIKVSNGFYLVNSSFKFFNVICEKPYWIPNIALKLKVNLDGELHLIVDQDIDKEKIYCFTDSVSFYPTKVKAIKKQDKLFVLKAIDYGYYWCTHTDTARFNVAESNRILYLKDKKSLTDLYALRIRGKIIDWGSKFSNDILLAPSEQTYDKIVANNAVMMEKIFNISKAQSNFSMWKQLGKNKIKIKKIFINGKTALLHVILNPKLTAAELNTGGGLNVTCVRPVYYCPTKGFLPTLSLGESYVNKFQCLNYSCKGNFNIGVYLVKTPMSSCTIASNSPEGNVEIEKMIKSLKAVLHNTSIPFAGEEMANAFDQVDRILTLNDNLTIPSELLHLLDQLGSRVDLNGSQSAIAIRDNIAMVVAIPNKNAPIFGIKFEKRKYAHFTEDAFKILTDVTCLLNLTSEDSEAVVHLPLSVATSSRRVSFVVYRTDRAFRSHAAYRLNSRVLSINVENYTKFDAGEVIDIYFSPMKEAPDRNEARACVFWQFTAEGGSWSRYGCTLIPASSHGLLDICRCTHLTHFAQVLISHTTFSQFHEEVLQVLSLVGLTLSVFGLFMVAFTAFRFRDWRSKFTNKVWLQLSLAIFILDICFLMVVFSKFKYYDFRCIVTGILIHYSVLASFCWMLVAAVVAYRKLVLVYAKDPSHKLLKASIFSWGFPCVVLGILLLIDRDVYAGSLSESKPVWNFCYPSGLALWLAVDLPMVVILLTNWTLFILIVCNIFFYKRVQCYGKDKNELLRVISVSCLLMFLFGLPWVFGLFAYNVVAAYFFTITSSMQGFILFIFFVIGNKKRDT